MELKKYPIDGIYLMTKMRPYGIKNCQLSNDCYDYLDYTGIREILPRHIVAPIVPSGRHDVVGMDCTYFGRRGIVVITWNDAKGNPRPDVDRSRVWFGVAL